MKNIFQYTLVLLLFFSWIQQVVAVSYPNAAPTNEVRGGYFMRWFENAFESCPPWHAISGFKFDKTDITNLENGKRICVPVWWGSAVVTQPEGGNSGPIFATALTPEAFDTLKESLRLLLKDQIVWDVQSKITTEIISQIEKTVTQKAVEQTANILEKNITDKLLSVINTYMENLKNEKFQLKGENDTIPVWGSGWTVLLSSILTQKNGNIGVSNRDPQAKLDIAWKLRIADGTQWSGSVLVSDANGVASWISPKNLFATQTCKVGWVWNVCYWENAFQKNTSGQSGVAIGVSALQNNTTWDGNVALGSSALQKNQSWSNNVALGRNAGVDLVSGDHNILIGAGVSPQKNNGSNQLNIGNWIYGDNGNISIGEQNSPAWVKLNLSGAIRIADGTHGSWKILVSDENGIARWQTINLNNIAQPPVACTKSDQVVGPRTYAVPELADAATKNVILTIPIANGNVIWTQTFTCENKTIKTVGSEQSKIECNTGFQSNWTACVPPNSAGPLGCDAMQFPLNGKTYEVDAIKNNFSSTAYATVKIPNGNIKYQQLFSKVSSY